MRLTITDDQFKEIVSALRNRQDLVDLLLDAKAIYDKSITDKKKGATKAAHSANKAKTKKKIENAINLSRMEQKPITISSVAKTAGIHYNTAKTHKEFIESQK